MSQTLKMLRLGAVLKKTALSRSTIYRFEANGEFPRRIQLSGNTVAWLESEVDEWIADRVQARGRGGRTERDGNGGGHLLQHLQLSRNITCDLSV